MRIVSPLSHVSLAYYLSISDLILGPLVTTAHSVHAARASGTTLRRTPRHLHLHLHLHVCLV